MTLVRDHLHGVDGAHVGIGHAFGVGAAGFDAGEADAGDEGEGSGEREGPTESDDRAFVAPRGGDAGPDSGGEVRRGRRFVAPTAEKRAEVVGLAHVG